MKRILVSGGSGFVGARLTERLLAQGHEVHLVLRPGHDPWRIDLIRGEPFVHLADIVDRNALSAVFNEVSPDWVFHLAAYGAYSWQRDADTMIATNINGTENMLRASRGAEAFVYAGSSSEYGFKDCACDENELLEPNSYYAVTKACATHLCNLAGRREKRRIVTLRLYSVFGPFEDPRRLLPTLLVLGLEGRLPPLVNPGVARDLVFVDDVCSAFVKAARVPGQYYGSVFNVGSARSSTIKDIVEQARRILAISDEPAWGSMPDRDWDTDTWVANVEKINERLSWRATVDLETGMKKTLEWLESDESILTFYRGRLGSALSPEGRS